MLLDRSDVIRDLIFMHQVLDYLVDGAALSPRSILTGAIERSAPASQIDESEDTFTVRLRAPGLSPDAFDVTLQGRYLTIEASLAEPEIASGAADRPAPIRAFRHTWRLPADVQGDRVEALYEEDTLTITLPKTERSRPRRIAIGRQSIATPGAMPLEFAPAPAASERAAITSPGSAPAEPSASGPPATAATQEAVPSADRARSVAGVLGPTTAEVAAGQTEPIAQSAAEPTAGDAKARRSAAKQPAARPTRTRPRAETRSKSGDDGAGGTSPRSRRKPAAEAGSPQPA